MWKASKARLGVARGIWPAEPGFGYNIDVSVTLKVAIFVDFVISPPFLSHNCQPARLGWSKKVALHQFIVHG